MPAAGDSGMWRTARERRRDNYKYFGKVTFVGDDDIFYDDADDFLNCIQEELPYRDTTGFRYEVLTDDPAIRKAADDILFDFLGEENPCELEDYTQTMGGI